jgi:hypothetical protein
MRAWFALTAGRYREVIEAAQAGQDAAANRSVSVQLLHPHDPLFRAHSS